MDGSYTISDITSGTNAVITLSSISNCTITETVTAPDCGCAIIAAPIGDDVTVCSGETIPALSVSVGTGLQVNWYRTASSTTVIAMNSTIYEDNTTGIYYAEAVDPSTGCTSSRTAITLTINPLPSYQEGNKECSVDLSTYQVTVNSDASNISSSAGTAVNNGNGTFTINNIPSNTNITVTLESAENCTRTETIIAPDCNCEPIVEPIGDNIFVCAGETIPPLSVSVELGLTANWYDTETGGTVLATNTTTYITNTAGTYYVEAFDPQTGCTSRRKSIRLLINALPTYQEGNKICNINLNTYEVMVSSDAATADSNIGTVINNGNETFTVKDIPNDLNVEITLTSSENCSRVEVITPADCDCGVINAPIGDDILVCSEETIPSLSVSVGTGLQVNWYSTETETVSIATNSTTYMTNTAGTYYAEAIDPSTGCTSSRTPIALVISSLPSYQEQTKDCSGDLNTYQVTIGSDASTVLSSGGTVLNNDNGTFTISDIPSATTVTLTLTNEANCTITELVTAPDCSCGSIEAPLGDDITVCSGETIPPLSVNVGTGLQVNWYSSSTSTSPLITNSATYLANTAGTYYAETVVPETGCASPRTAIVLTLNSLPTYQEGMEECSLDTDTYQVMINSDAVMVSSNLGIVVDNSDGTFTIKDIPNDSSVEITLTNSENCSRVETFIAPECASNSSDCSNSTTDELKANAGEDQETCDNVFQLNSNLPTNTTGIWTTNSSAVIDNPNTFDTRITNISEPGEYIFIWTLSLNDCPDFSTDTVVITKTENRVEAVDDFIAAIKGRPIEFNILDNDIISSGEIEIEILTTIKYGILQDRGNGNFVFIPRGNFEGDIEFEYEICDRNCPNGCAIGTVQINIKKLIKRGHGHSIGLTPNSPDGTNQTLIFDNIFENPNNELIIVNRWGDIIYKESNYNNDWSGTNQDGEPLPSGTYYFMMRFDVNNGELLYGTITILR